MCIIKEYKSIRESEKIKINRIALFSASILLFGLLVACNNKEDHSEIEPSTEASTTDNSTNSSTQNSLAAGSENHEQLTSQFPKSTLTASTDLDSVIDTPSVRAETVTKQGTLLMISKGREERGHLVVSSNFGVEGDKTFQSNYSIVYKQGKDDEILLELPAFMFAQPNDQKLSFEKVSFKDADVYFLSPQYKTGHGLEGYVFAVDNLSGEASALKIINKGQDFNTLVFSETDPLPYIENDRLVVDPPIGAGTPEEETKEVHYKLDLANKQLAAE